MFQGIAAFLRERFLALTAGNAKLIIFFVKQVPKFMALPQELLDETAMDAKIAKGRDFMIWVEGGSSFVDGYQQDFKQLAGDLENLTKQSVIDPHAKQCIFWLIRLGCVACAFAGSFRLTFLTSLLQFLFLPFSLFAVLGSGVEIVFILYTGHALMFPLLKFLLHQVLPAEHNPAITISPSFLVLFLMADQLLCLVCLFRTPKGKTASMPTSRIMASVTYGFLNCKTYYLMLLPLIFGLEIPVFAWLLDAALGLSSNIHNIIKRFWEVLFYNAHRMAHIKEVYPDAHKFHHYLHDCTAFDAHIFGSGAPEEWLILMCDLALALCFGCAPASLSYHVLQMSWYNKWGFHTRSEQPEFHFDNFHADHHALHKANFGMTYPFELLMKTIPPQLGHEVEWLGFIVKRIDRDGNVCLIFNRVDDKSTFERAQQHAVAETAWRWSQVCNRYDCDMYS
eukprot:TRINITY_DN10729_c0_g1_i1.p1 TRINITY_DN10729_c0_g1~~TRINITY_DN10729_c0_g1_i1.p1  ORF type:complete len:451 (-),score=73.74 TRINITY_DN10729_c0_g1_i1:326-1678(-)